MLLGNQDIFISPISLRDASTCHSILCHLLNIYNIIRLLLITCRHLVSSSPRLLLRSSQWHTLSSGFRPSTSILVLCTWTRFYSYTHCLLARLPPLPTRTVPSFHWRSGFRLPSVSVDDRLTFDASESSTE